MNNYPLASPKRHDEQIEELRRERDIAQAKVEMLRKALTCVQEWYRSWHDKGYDTLPLQENSGIM